MSYKQKGIRGERELVHKFWAVNWACLRIAGSGSIKYPSPDLLVGNGNRKLAIECKVTKDQKKYFEKIRIDALQTFAEIFGAEPWIAIKFKGLDWLFIHSRDMSQGRGTSYSMSSEEMKKKGVLFEELIKI